MVVAPAALLIVVASGPRGEPDRLVGILVECLFEELRTRQAMMHPEGFTAAFGHRRNAGVGLELAGGRQARGADRPCPGEAREELVVGVGGEDRGDLALEGVDGLEQGPELGGVGLHRETERVDDRRVGGERLGGGHLVEPGVDHGGAAAVVLLIEPAHGGGARALDGGQRGPLDEKVARLARVERADPVEGLREILFQQAGEPVGQAAAQIDELAPVLGSSWSLRAMTVSGRQGRSWSRCLRSRSKSKAASVGSSLAPLGWKAWR